MHRSYWLLIFVVVLGSTHAALSQSLSSQDRDRGVIMLKAARDDIRKNYYDAAFRGLDQRIVDYIDIAHWLADYDSAVLAGYLAAGDGDVLIARRDIDADLAAVNAGAADDQAAVALLREVHFEIDAGGWPRPVDVVDVYGNDLAILAGNMADAAATAIMDFYVLDRVVRAEVVMAAIAEIEAVPPAVGNLKSGCDLPVACGPARNAHSPLPALAEVDV